MYRLLIAILGCLVAVTAQAEDWSGGYVGISAGGFRGKSSWTTTELAGTPVSCSSFCFSDTNATFSNANGGQASAYLGWNWLFSNHFLVGLETGAGSTNSRGSLNHTPGWVDTPPSDDNITATYEYNGGAAARIGLVAGPVMIYGIAGPWWQKVSLRYNCTANTNSWCTFPQSENKADALRGWMAGGGFEWRVASRWSTRLDYRYAKYEDKDYTFFSKTATDTVVARTGAKTYTVSLGVSYRF